MAKNKPHKFDTKPNGKAATGRPSKMDALYPTAEAFQLAIDAYFTKIEADNGTPTKEEMILALGFCAAFHIRQWLASKGDTGKEFITAYKNGTYRIVSAYSKGIASGTGYGPGLMFLICNLTRKAEDDEDQFINPRRIELTGKDGGDVKFSQDVAGKIKKIFGNEK